MTVLALAPTFSQIARLCRPSAAASTIRARVASAWPVFRARLSDVKSARSFSLNSILTAAWPNANPPPSLPQQIRMNFAIRTLERIPIILVHSLQR